MVPGAGFWGPPTSSVDWCEANYEHTRYVCELYNTLSSTALVAAGLLGIALHRTTLEKRFLVAFAAIAVVGIGSIAFHSTLRFELQMLDELPMLYTALVLIYIVLEDRAEPRFGPWFPRVLAAHGALVSALSAFTRGALQFYLFQFSFASMELFGLYRAYRVYRRSQSAVARTLFRAGASAYAVAVGLWFVDLEECDLVGRFLPAHGFPNPQLHAWWHVLVSCGLYLLMVMLAWDRLEVLGERPQLRFVAGMVPYLRREEARTPSGVAADHFVPKSRSPASPSPGTM
jgi:dihydroceramidase